MVRPICKSRINIRFQISLLNGFTNDSAPDGMVLLSLKFFIKNTGHPPFPVV